MVEEIHDAVDRRAAELAKLHAARLQCRRGCAGCCVDALTVFEVEAEKIRAGAAELLENGAPHAEGACAFLDDAGACRIYALRPYVCRTQGLPLRWIDEEAAVEYRDICPLNDEGEPIEELLPDECWTLGEAEAALARAQLERHGELRRVGLRDLFRRPPD